MTSSKPPTALTILPFEQSYRDDQCNKYVTAVFKKVNLQSFAATLELWGSSDIYTYYANTAVRRPSNVGGVNILE